MSGSSKAPGVEPGLLAAVAEGRHYDPHAVLGAHPARSGWVVRARRPLAQRVLALLEDGSSVPLAHIGGGVWEGALPAEPRSYRLRAEYEAGSPWEAEDPYRFAPTLGELDLHLIREGRHERLWEVLGAHVRSVAGVPGTSFAVWAPDAQAVRVIGDFNGWEGSGHAMRSLGSSGVWELFVPGLRAGELYKFEILSASGAWVTKADPMARQTQAPPETASVVAASDYVWGDADWLAARAQRQPHREPMSVYEMHLGSWRPGLGYRELADPLVEYLGGLGYTHVEFLPLMEHPYGPSWGYQVTGFYAPTARFGSPDDLRYLIDRLHQAGFGVILDWVPGHFPKDDWALARFDGQPLYEHPDPRRGEQKDWGTLVFDFGRPEVRNFLVANALYWLDEFHADGLRVDAVASMLYLDYSRAEGEWLPNVHGGRENLEAISFLQEANATAYKLHPGIVMIAEESTSWPGITAPTNAGGLGFGMKWNMGWMHDTLEYIAVDPLYRLYHHGQITFSLVYAWSEKFVLPISHDEVVHGKGSLLSRMPGDRWQAFANLRAYLAFMWAHPGKKLLFMGQEFAQYAEWSEQRGLDWGALQDPAHAGVSALVRQLNALYRTHPELWQRDHEPAGFEWLQVADAASNVLGFLRRDESGRPFAALFNFSGRTIDSYRFGLPEAGRWREVLNTDAAEYGGAGAGNAGTVQAVRDPWAGRPASAEVTLPALGAVFLVPER